MLLDRLFSCAKFSVVATCSDFSNRALFSCACYYLQLPSSTFWSTKPNATFNLAAHLRTQHLAFPTNIWRPEYPRQSCRLCRRLPFSTSLSTKKCLHVSSSSFRLMSSTSPICGATSTLWALEPLCAPFYFRLSYLKLSKKWKTLSHFLNLWRTPAVASECFLAM